MNHYRTSDGSRIAKSVIDRKVREAKNTKISNQLNDYGYNFCEECGRSSDTFLDCSHDMSVDQCQKMGKSELAFDIENITIRCRDCHKKHDKNGINI